MNRSLLTLLGIKNKRVPLKIIQFLLTSILLIFIINTIYLIFILKQTQNLPELPRPYEMMRFVVHSYGDNSITARFWFYDQDGNELSSLERTWPATFLELHFHYISYNKKNIVYPIRIQNIQNNKKKQSPGTDLRFFVQSQNLSFQNKQERINQKASSNLETFILSSNKINRIFSLFYPKLVENKTLSLENAVRGFVYSVYYDDGIFYLQ